MPQMMPPTAPPILLQKPHATGPIGPHDQIGPKCSVLHKYAIWDQISFRPNESLSLHSTLFFRCKWFFEAEREKNCHCHIDVDVQSIFAGLESDHRLAMQLSYCAG